MIPLKDFRVSRTNTIVPGALVAWSDGPSYRYGLTVSIQRGSSTAQGVLTLSPSDGIDTPLFKHIGTDYCLVFPNKPVVTWNAKLSDLKRPLYGVPPPGHIAVCGERPLLSGLGPNDDPSNPSYWELATGQQTPVEFDSMIILTQWELSIPTADGTLLSIVRCGAPAPT